MSVRVSFAFVVLSAVLVGGCGGGSQSGSLPAPSGAEMVVGPVATRAVGDGLRKPVIVNAGEVTFVGLAGATFTNLAMINPTAARLGADASNLAYYTLVRDSVVFVHPRTKRQRSVVQIGAAYQGDVATSPDGFRVYYTQKSGGVETVRAVNIDGTSPQIIYTLPSDPFRSITGLSASPDGTQLAIEIVLNLGGSPTFSVRRIPVAGGATVELGAGQYPRFSSDGTRVVVKRPDGIYAINMSGTSAVLFFGAANVSAISEAGTWGQTLANSIMYSIFITGGAFELATAANPFTDLVAHRQLPFVAGKVQGQTSARLYNLLNSSDTWINTLDMGSSSAFLPHRERRDAVAAGTADPQVAGFVASQLGRHAGSLVAWDAQTRPATAVVAEPSPAPEGSVVYTVDAGASNKITRVFSLESVWEAKNTLPLSAPADGLVIAFDGTTGLPGAIIPYIATRGSGKPKITRLPGGGVRVEGELAGVYGEGGKLLSGPTNRYETQPSQP